MIYVFDIDGTICSIVPIDSYDKAIPNLTVIRRINRLYDSGNTIYFYTGRHSNKKKVTEEWMRKHKVKYHKIFYNKPKADIYVDDLAINSLRYLRKPNYWDKIFKKRGDYIRKAIK